MSASAPIEPLSLRQMLALLRHRGPDQFGIYIDDQIGLGSARLSIVDLNRGQQPIANEDERLWIVFNGEIFNHGALRRDLQARGHRFTTESDTEVVLHLYEDAGPDCLTHLNGQFAIAIWDAREQMLFLARDRLGVRPLFYTLVDGSLLFASELKAILADPRVRAEIDPLALDQIFTFWCAVSPRTIFRNLVEVPAGHYLLARRGKVSIHRYWQLTFPDATDCSQSQVRSTDDDLAALRSLLVDATRIRLRADVPVGAYLSGGLDSSLIAAIIRSETHSDLHTFSISFDDPAFDESEHQQRMARFLGTEHRVIYAAHADIARVFPDVIWHTETPILRTSPAPLFMLSQLVHDQHFKVVLTGEGADEFFAGYDIFKEAMVRRFWARQPQSRLRPLLLRRLYPDIPALSANTTNYLAAFFGERLGEVDARDYSHAIRWRNTSRAKRFFSQAVKQAVQHPASEAAESVPYPPDFMRWHPLHRAQYLEITLFLSQYLLSAQGDRVAMAHSVEGRHPFLDHRLVEFANRLPPHLKLHRLREKFLLRLLAREWLPPDIQHRTKRPYRAPIHRSFFNHATQDYVHELLSPATVRRVELFKPVAVSQLVQKIERGLPLSETDDMALAGILSTQLVHHLFVADFRRPPPLSPADDVKICLGERLRVGD